MGATRWTLSRVVTTLTEGGREEREIEFPLSRRLEASIRELSKSLRQKPACTFVEE